MSDPLSLYSSRRVISQKDKQILLGKGKDVPVQGLSQKLIDYIPVEVVTAWTAINGTLISLDSAEIYWASFLILGILVPIYMWRFTSDPELPAAKFQIIGATGAFVAWVFAMGGPFTKIPGFTYYPEYGTIVLGIYTVILVILLGKDNNPVTEKR